MFKWLNKLRLKGLPTKTDTIVLVVDSNGDVGINTTAGGSGDITGVDLTGGTGISIASETGTTSGN